MPTFNEDLIVNGEIGVGTTNPRAPLDVVQDQANQPAARFVGDVALGSRPSGGELWNLSVNSAGNLEINANDDSGGVTRMTLNDDTGNVGIGTDNPQSPLHVFSSASPATLRVQSGGAFGPANVEFWSDPQGATNEWRPGFIQSTDQGGFTGGLGFFVNGAGAANKTSAVEVMRVTNRKVGIGTTDPQVTLDVEGTKTINATSDGIVNIGNSSGAHVTLDNNEIHARNGSSTSNLYINDFGGNVLIARRGRVGIGTSSPQSKLHVEGDLRVTGDIQIKDWSLSVPDYVFAEDYALRPLSELNAYIQQHKHLPEIPSEREIQAGGVNLGEFCMSLLKKVEELSLYVLQQQEVLQAQSDRLSQIENTTV